MGHCHFVSLNCLETFQIYHSKVAPADGIPSSLESVRQECVMVLVLLLAASSVSGRWCEGVLCHPSCCLFSVLGGSETVDAGVHVQSRWWRHQKPIQMWLGDLKDISVESTNDWKMNDLLSVRFFGHLLSAECSFDEGPLSGAVTAGCSLQNLLHLVLSEKTAWEAVYVCRLTHPTIAPFA